MNSYLLIVKRVNVLEELLDQFNGNDLQTLYEHSELRFINNSIVVDVNSAELLRESREEFLMFTQLEV